MEDTTETRITLRLPTVLRDRLIEAARASSRSMNGEIVFRLDVVLDDLKKTAEMLEKREEALFTDRVQLRKMLAERDRMDEANRLAEESAVESGTKRIDLEFDLREARNQALALQHLLDSAERTIRALTDAASKLALDTAAVEGIAHRVAEILMERGVSPPPS
ncbi:MAG: Arc family DNA-binding protein [Mesorhizobium sp.]|nr:MAG: Arc family DNA-binding protein [Mesorhizobium sp.]